jgi:hypothetical protein
MGRVRVWRLILKKNFILNTKMHLTVLGFQEN